MLTDYDATAIADILGIAFRQGAPAGPAPTRGAKAPTATPGTEFIIDVGGRRVLVVEAEVDRPAGRAPGSPGFAQRQAAFEDEITASSSVLIEKAVERGLPRQALRHVAEALAGGDTSKIAAFEWRLVPKTTLERRATQLSPQESERTERVARLFVQARRTLGTAAEAREFLTTPHPELDGRSPVEASRTDLGTRRTEQILHAVEYGLAL